MEKRKVLVYEISIDSKNLEEINERIDAAVKEHFIGQQICIRVLGSEVHKEKNIDELIDIIIDTGMDRYDTMIKSERYHNKESKNVDFFALDLFIGPETKILGQFTWRKMLRPPLKIDVVIIYNMTEVVCIPYTPIGRTDTKFDGFAFKNVLNRQNAIEAIYKIYRTKNRQEE